jgi:hypothetical protein
VPNPVRDEAGRQESRDEAGGAGYEEPGDPVIGDSERIRDPQQERGEEKPGHDPHEDDGRQEEQRRQENADTLRIVG